MAQAAVSKMQINHSANWALAGVSFAHLLNDAMQTVVPSAFPLFQQTMQLSFAQMGWIAFTLNITASVLQPLVGYMSDRKPMPILLPGGMLFSLIGVLGFALSSELWMLLVSAALIGIGSSILHPESSRVAHLVAVAEWHSPSSRSVVIPVRLSPHCSLPLSCSRMGSLVFCG